MSSRVLVLVRTLVVVAAGFALLLAGLSQATAVEEGVAVKKTTQAESGDGGAIIQATERISIPYGFNSTLPLTEDGASVVASGEGACTAGEAITIAFTVTQSTSGASVTGVWDGTCTGELQTWTNTPTATPSPNFMAGAAEACAFAETRDDSVTDTQDWCDDVLLTSHTLFLPRVQRP